LVFSIISTLRKMLYGDNEFYLCPKCGNLLTRQSLVSGNTCDSVLYSDAKRVAPMLPEFPNLTKCKKCNSIFWLQKLEDIGSDEWREKLNLNWQDADEAEFLTIEDYFRAIDLKIAENEAEEYFIRQRIWWTFNDRVRENKGIFVNDKDESLYRSNCFALIYMLDVESDNNKIAMAELNRNLGNFDKCISIIDSIQDENLKWLVDRLRIECLEKHRWVIKLTT